ncbi:MAG: Fic family protein [Desulfarculus sp.]|nr:Fic family protein [Desulfarculus sp.]
MTFKSGQFVFSRLYDRQTLDRLFLEARVLKETVADLPVLPWLASKLEEEAIRRSIHSTAALEGNPLSEEQVGDVLSEDDQQKTASQSEVEIHNLKLAYHVCKSLLIKGPYRLLDEDLISDFHKFITINIEHPHNRPGSYRDHLVKVGDKEHGGVYTPPKIRADIETLMKEFIAWINGEELLAEEPVVRAALAHFHLAKIHPFSDGNGRTARLVEALCLQAHGLGHVPAMLSNYYYRHPDDYYWAFSRSERNPEHDVTPFIQFVLRAFIAALYDIKDRMTSAIRQFALREHVARLRQAKELTQRQLSLLTLLLDSGQDFSLPDLFRDPKLAIIYRDVSERTARRDLERLLRLRLLKEQGPARYRLDDKALG